MADKFLVIKLVHGGSEQFVPYQQNVGNIFLQVEEENFKADMHILLSRSAFFRKIEKELFHGAILKLQGITPLELENLLVFLHEGRIELPISNIPKFTEILTTFEVDCENPNSSADDCVIGIPMHQEGQQEENPQSDNQEETMENEIPMVDLTTMEEDDGDNDEMENEVALVDLTMEEDEDEDGIVEVSPPEMDEDQIMMLLEIEQGREEDEHSESDEEEEMGGPTVDQIWTPNAPKTKKKCKTCGTMLSSKNALSVHMKRKHGPTYKAICLPCNKTCDHKVSLRDHLYRNHKGAKDLTNILKFVNKYEISMGTTQYESFVRFQKKVRFAEI